MQPTAVLAPLFAYVLLIFVVWVELYRRRMDYITSNKIHPQKLADATDAKELLKPAQAPANNFVNQFELPMLFFLAGIIAYVTKSASTLVVGLMGLRGPAGGAFHHSPGWECGDPAFLYLSGGLCCAVCPLGCSCHTPVFVRWTSWVSRSITMNKRRDAKWRNGWQIRTV